MPTTASPFDEQTQRRYEAIKGLREKGHGIRRIARDLGLQRNTVRRYLRCDTAPPSNKGRRRPSRLSQFAGHLKHRWGEGEHNASSLWRELVGRGYKGDVSSVQKYVRRWRETITMSCPVPPTGFSPRRTARLLLTDERKLNEAEQVFITRLCKTNGEITMLQTLGKEFQRLVKERSSEEFTAWCEKVRAGEISELKNWAKGLLSDEAAVQAAMRSEWSNGQTEGQVNRLKTIKRQMYGRAKFDLLRARVLCAS